MLRNLIKSNPFFYRLWLFTQKHVFGKMRKIRTPKSTDPIYLDGYPRSGNSFLKGLIVRFLPNQPFASHLHTIAPLKMALQYKLDTLVLFRNPLESISSLLVMKRINPDTDSGKAELNNQINDYLNYYQYVLSKVDQVILVHFEIIGKQDSLGRLLSNYIDASLDSFNPIYTAYLEEYDKIQ